MTVFEYFSLVSIILSLFLTLDNIRKKYAKPDVEIQDIYLLGDRICLKVLIYNKSSSKSVITESSLSSGDNSVLADSFERLLTSSSNGRNYSQKIPFSILSSTADSVFLSFSNIKNLDEYTEKETIMCLKINGKKISKSCDFKNKIAPEDQLFQEFPQ